jgi:hypothetical protein
MKQSQRRGGAINFKILANKSIFYGLVAMSTVNQIENAAVSLWFVGYYKHILDALLIVWFWMKQSQRRGTALLFKMLLN